jgi:hypothetical protein
MCVSLYTFTSHSKAWTLVILYVKNTTKELKAYYWCRVCYLLWTNEILFVKYLRDLAKFGSRLERQVEEFRNLAIFWWLGGTHCLNFFPHDVGTLGSPFFSTKKKKKPLHCTRHNFFFFWSSGCKILHLYLGETYLNSFWNFFFPLIC